MRRMTTDDRPAMTPTPATVGEHTPAAVASSSAGGPAVAVLVPCFNEEHAIAGVVADFEAALPGARVYVYDNASTDRTVERALEAGAAVGHEQRKGKGNVMRRMFADIEADVYVMVDGDGTYDASTASVMVERLWQERLDMVVGARQADTGDDGVVYRPGHATGNAAFSKALKTVIGGEFTDIFSGYRVMSRRFVKSMPVHSSGFEIETELSAHAIEVDAACAEVPTRYTSRMDGSESKLSTYRDGWRIAWTILRLFESVRPLPCFGLITGVLTAVALILAAPVVVEFAQTDIVARFPTAILAASIQIIALLSLTCGIILRSVQKARQEARRLVYLSISAPGHAHQR